MKLTITLPLVVSALLLSSAALLAQHSKVPMPSDLTQSDNEPSAQCSGELYAPLVGEVVPGEKINPWMRTVKTERIHDQTTPLDSAQSAYLDMLKQKDLSNPASLGDGPTTETDELGPANPVVVSGFTASALSGGVPPDNTMAISNGGYIVSAINSRIAIYNTSGTELATATLYSFFKGANNNVVNDFYDPVVIYDSGSDRFVFVCLVGRHSSNARVLVAFSKTNNPTQAWYQYYLTGNPLNNNCWTDYPRVGVSNNEVYVTGNLYNNSNQFNQPVIYQITKSGGYNGNSNLQWQYWYNIPGGAQTIIPLSWGGQGNYGPGCYLVSHSNNSTSKTLLFSLTNDLTSSNEQLVKYEVTTPIFQQGNKAYQKNTAERLDSGDPRIQSGYYMDGFAHYVFAARYNSTAWTGIHYHRINVSSKALTTRQIGASGWDFAWPSVAWSGKSTGDKSSMINFLYSSSSVFPSAAVVEIDNLNEPSTNSIYYTNATGFVNLNNESYSRWGDYTNIARKKNTTSAPRLWVVGCHGNLNPQFYAARIAQIRPGGSNFGDEGDDRQEESLPETTFSSLAASPEVACFPNPSSTGTPFNLDFSLSERTFVRVDILTMDGRVVFTLLEDAVKAGNTRITLERQALEPGIYAVQVTANGEILKTVKLVVTH